MGSEDMEEILQELPDVSVVVCVKLLEGVHKVVLVEAVLVDDVDVLQQLLDL